MRKLRLIDVLAFLWQLTRLEDPGNAEFGRELLAAVIGDIHEKIGVRPETLWDVAKRLGEQRAGELRFNLMPFAPGYYGCADLTQLFDRFGGLDENGFTAELLAHIMQQFPAFKRVWGPGAVQTPATKQRARTKRRGGLPRKTRPLTNRQRDALELLGRHDGKVEAAAREWRISRQAMSKLRDAALRKAFAAGHTDLAALAKKSAARKSKPQRLPRDQRGQEVIADPNAPDLNDPDV